MTTYFQHADDGGGEGRVVLCAQHDAVRQDEAHYAGECEVADEQRVGPLRERLQLKRHKMQGKRRGTPHIQ